MPVPRRAPRPLTAASRPTSRPAPPPVPPRGSHRGTPRAPHPGAPTVLPAVAAALVLAVSLMGCTGSPDVSGGRQAAPGVSPSPTRPEIPELVRVDYEAPRDLTPTEELMLHEAGPFAGEAFDEDAVVDAVLALRPGSAEEWERAILGQIHGDYAEALAGTIEFDPAITDPGAGPTASWADAAVGTNHFALVLDASGSMGERAGTGTRMDEARGALRRFAARLPQGSTVSLRVYGQAGDAGAEGKHASCASSRVVYDGEADGAGFAAALDDVVPTGWTPLARGVREAAGDVPDDATDALVYVVTDGRETCGGDPVAAARELARTGTRPVVNVIGFRVGDADHEALRAIADAGGGSYTDAGTETELERYLDAEYSRMTAAWDAWRRAEVDRIDAAGRAAMAEARRHGDTLVDTAEAEGRAGREVTRALADRGALDPATEAVVREFFLDRKNELWGYASRTRAARNGEAFREKVRVQGEAYATGTSRWSEFYRQKDGS